MLEDLKKRVPNISPSCRIVGGFSNGAHAIGMYLGNGYKEFSDFFNAYIFGDGGVSREYDLGSLRGKRAFVVYGDQSGGFGFRTPSGYCHAEVLLKALEKSRIQITDVPMEGVGHVFPKKYKEQCKDWVTDFLEENTHEYDD